MILFVSISFFCYNICDKFQFREEHNLKNDILRIAISIIVGYFVLWYAGAMFNFLPFFGDDLTLRAVGYTGLLMCLVIVLCTCWIINEIKKNK